MRGHTHSPGHRRPGLATTFEIAYDTRLATTTAARRDRLDASIAGQRWFTPVVTRLGCLHGIAPLTAFGLSAESGNWHRVIGRSIGTCLGLVLPSPPPGARAVGVDDEDRQWGCTRRLLIKAAWVPPPPNRIGAEPRCEQDAASPAARDGERANRRLHDRWVWCNPAPQAGRGRHAAIAALGSDLDAYV